MPVEQDTYAVLSLANIDFALAGAPDKLHEREERLKRACKCYRKVLDKDPSNQFAANGVGMVLAENARLEEAKAVFMAVREACPDNPQVWFNLGHVFLALGNPQQATEMYKSCAKRIKQYGSGSVLTTVEPSSFAEHRETKNMEGSGLGAQVREPIISHPAYTLLYTFIARFTPMYTRYTCIGSYTTHV